jgi:hypothetical protein
MTNIQIVPIDSTNHCYGMLLGGLLHTLTPGDRHIEYPTAVLHVYSYAST